MKVNLRKFAAWPGFFLFLLAVLAYAPLFWQRGFYWDELPWTWVYYRLGPQALAQLFSTSRPFWGALYQLSLPLIGPHPWAWQLLLILLRWLTALQVWLLLRRLWPHSRLPLWAAALFVVYPGLGQNFVALMYTHFYLVLNLFLLSLLLSLKALEQPKPWLHLPALALAALNLLTMEYFYFLEFLRLALFWLAAPAPKNRRAWQHFAPYLTVFLGVTAWRTFFFPNQNASYSYQTLENLRADFLGGLWTLMSVLFRAFWESAPHAWLLPFEPLNLATLGLFTAFGGFVLALAGTLLSGLYLRPRAPETDSPAWAFVLLGLLAWILGGGALWLVGERTLPQLHFSADRFTLPLMFGSSLMLAGLLGTLTRKPRLQGILLALLLGFSVGKQFQTNALYRRDWEAQRNFFWQLAWRAPALQPGTTLLTNDLPVQISSDNSLTAPLNWMYDLRPDPQHLPRVEGRVEMQYMLYFASVRTQEGRALGTTLRPGLDFEQNYLATYFKGNTSRMVVLFYAPPGCLRVLDPEIDPLNKLLPPDLRAAAALSNPALIGAQTGLSLPPFYQPEPTRGWCYIFSAAELARQSGDWPRVVELHRQAANLGNHVDDPLENFVFIEAYAHTAGWQAARALTRETYKFSKEILRPTLCALWQRIDRDLPGQFAPTQVFAELGCAGD